MFTESTDSEMDLTRSCSSGIFKNLSFQLQNSDSNARERHASTLRLFVEHKRHEKYTINMTYNKKNHDT